MAASRHDSRPLEAKLAEADLALTAERMASPLPDAPPATIMWMPGGIHRIAASRGGKPVDVEVQVDAAGAAAVEAAFREHRAGRQRPYFDFNHRRDEAAAYPTEFFWSEAPEPGIYARLEWTAAGTAAVTGRNYRAFSPAFFVDAASPARVVGAPFVMGGLVNDPAFREIRPITAHRHPQAQITAMNKQMQLLGLLAAINVLQRDRSVLAARTDGDHAAAIREKDEAITAKMGEATRLQNELAAENPSAPLTIEINDATQVLAARDGEISRLKAENERLATEASARRDAEIESAIEAAVGRGAIPPKDEKAKTTWRKACQAETATLELLRGLPGNAVIEAGRLTTSTDRTSGVTITSEDTRRVVKAYHEEPIAAKRATIYARDIRARLVAGDELVLEAANSLGGVVGNLVVQRSLDLLKTEFPLLSRVSTDFSDQNAAYGQTIKTRLLTPPAATDYNTSTGYASSDVTTTDVDVVINAHKAVSITFNVNELAGTRRMLFDEQREGMHFSLGEALVSALYALITSGNYTNATTKAKSSFGRGTLTQMAKALNGVGRKAPKNNRTLLLNGDYFEVLANDSAVVNLATMLDRTLIEQYKIPPIAGFQPFEAIDLPSTGNLNGFGLSPDAMAVVTRLPNDYSSVFPGVSAGGLVSTVTNPDTGVSVMLVQFIDHKLGSATMRVALMYGVAVGRATSGERLISG